MILFSFLNRYEKLTENSGVFFVFFFFWNDSKPYLKQTNKQTKPPFFSSPVRAHIINFGCYHVVSRVYQHRYSIKTINVNFFHTCPLCIELVILRDIENMARGCYHNLPIFLAVEHIWLFSAKIRYLYSKDKKGLKNIFLGGTLLFLFFFFFPICFFQAAPLTSVNGSYFRKASYCFLILEHPVWGLSGL